MATIGKKGLALIKNAEGCELTAYQDSVDTWTIGYGHTGNVDGKPVRKGMKITQDKANDLLVSDCQDSANAVDNKKYVAITLNSNQRDALISFTFNLGPGWLRVLCKNRNASQISEHFMDYTTAGGQQLKGLVTRRKAEQALFNSTDGLSNEEIYASSNDSTSSDSDSSSDTASTQTTKDITTVTITNVAGSSSTRVADNLDSAMRAYECDLLIQNGNTIFSPQISELTLTQERKGSPATLEFTCYKDTVLDFVEGNAVRYRYNNANVFFGYVFKKSRTDDLSKIKVTAYDQIRYLKAKDTIIYENKKYSDVLQMIAADYKLKLGDVADTGYVIPSRIDEETTLIDILQNASDETVLNTANLYVLYDDFGSLTLRHIKDMFVDVYIGQSTTAGIEYSTDIENTYNRVKIAIDNDQSGEREVYMSQDADSQWQYGILNYYEKIDSSSSSETSNTSASGSSGVSDYMRNVAKNKSQVLLKYYNKKQRSLQLKNCIGNSKVRGGSVIFCSLNLGDVDLNSQMIVEKVTHKWSEGVYTMDVTLIGGEDLNFV